MNPAEFANIARVEQTLWWYRGMNRIFFRMLEEVTRGRQVRRVLEAGCGTGYLSSLLERDGWPMVAIDLGVEGLRYARGMGLERAAQADIRQLPFRDASFDLVLSMDVIVHLERGAEQVAFDETARVLAPGGIFLVRVSALDMLRSRHSIHAHERQRFTRGRLLGCVRAAGMEPIRCTYANSLLMPLALAKFRLWEPLTNAAPASGVVPLNPAVERMFYGALAAESAMIGAGINLPLGQSLVLAARRVEGSSPSSSGGGRP